MERRWIALIVGGALIVGLALLAAGCGSDRSEAARIEVGGCVAGAGVKCIGMNLAGGDLIGADLRRADLSRSNLQGAILRDADLRGADLRRADLRGADLSGADLRGARLDGARLDDALMIQAATDGAEQYSTARVCNLTRPDGSVTRRGCPREAPAKELTDLTVANPTGYMKVGKPSCDAPVGPSVEIRLAAAMVGTVDLQLDGVSVRRLTTLFWLPETSIDVAYPCDGKPHTYTMVVTTPGLYPFVVSKEVFPA